MARNIELKIPVDNLAEYRRRAQLIAEQDPIELQQTDIFFHVASGRLKLRLENGSPGQLIAYQRADVAEARVSDYEICWIDDSSTMESILERACGTWAKVIKRREVYLVGQTRIHLDSVEGLGHFIEIEVVLGPGQSDTVGHAEMQKWLEHLGLENRPVEPRAYADLLQSILPQVK